MPGVESVHQAQVGGRGEQGRPQEETAEGGRSPAFQWSPTHQSRGTSRPCLRVAGRGFTEDSLACRPPPKMETPLAEECASMGWRKELVARLRSCQWSGSRSQGLSRQEGGVRTWRNQERVTSRPPRGARGWENGAGARPPELEAKRPSGSHTGSVSGVREFVDGRPRPLVAAAGEAVRGARAGGGGEREGRAGAGWTRPRCLCLCDLGQATSPTRCAFYPETSREKRQACTLRKGRPSRLLVRSYSELREVTTMHAKP